MVRGTGVKSCSAHRHFASETLSLLALGHQTNRDLFPADARIGQVIVTDPRVLRLDHGPILHGAVLDQNRRTSHVDVLSSYTDREPRVETQLRTEVHCLARRLRVERLHSLNGLHHALLANSILQPAVELGRKIVVGNLLGRVRFGHLRIGHDNACNALARSERTRVLGEGIAIVTRIQLVHTVACVLVARVERAGVAVVALLGRTLAGLFGSARVKCGTDVAVVARKTHFGNVLRTLLDVAEILRAVVAIADVQGKENLARFFSRIGFVQRQTYRSSALGLNRRETILVNVTLPERLSDALPSDTRVFGSGRILVRAGRLERVGLSHKLATDSGVARIVGTDAAIIANLALARRAGAGRTEVALGTDIAVIARVGVRDAYAALGLVARIGGAEVLVVALRLLAGAFAASVALVAIGTRVAVAAQNARLDAVLAARLSVARVVGAGVFVVAVDDLPTALPGHARVARGAHAAVVAALPLRCSGADDADINGRTRRVGVPDARNLSMALPFD